MSSTGYNGGTTNDIVGKPLWQYVTKLGKSEGGGNIYFKCNFCQAAYKGSYSRVKAHLLKISGYGIRICPEVMPQHLIEMKNQVDPSELQLKKLMPKSVLLPVETPSQSPYSVHMSPMDTNSSRQDIAELKKRKAKSETTLENPFSMQVREQLDSEIAKMFFSAGLPFNLAKNPYYRSCFALAANNNILGYEPPTYNALRTKLLQKERANIERLLEPIKDSWREKSVTIVCDGWTDPQRRPLINFIAISKSGPMFLRAVNCEEEYRDKYFISNLIKEVILEVGPRNVIQVITDNAPVCRAAGLLIEQAYPHIFWTPCVVHTLNLALKSICAPRNTETNQVAHMKCHWISEVASDAMTIKNFIVNHSIRLFMFNEFSKLKVLTIADTRFASMIVMLKRFKVVKSELQSMVSGEQWSYFQEDDVGKAKFIKEKLLDIFWWDKIDYILAFTEPIYDFIRFVDTNKDCLHLIYENWDSMMSKVKMTIYKYEMKGEKEESSFWNIVKDILEDRWSKSNTPLHCLAHSLNPSYSSKEWSSENSHHFPPQEDLEISSMRKTCLKRHFPNEDERRSWWLIHGAPCPLLQGLAIKLLSQPSSSSCCERNWSMYSFVQSIRRNKIMPQRAEDLVFVHNNLRLLSRRTPQYLEGETEMWDVAGDAFDPLDGVGIAEIANLSLDDPEFESVLFDDEGIDEVRTYQMTK